MAYEFQVRRVDLQTGKPLTAGWMLSSAWKLGISPARGVAGGQESIIPSTERSETLRYTEYGWG